MSLSTKPHFQAEEDEIKKQERPHNFFNSLLNGDSYILKPRGLSIVWGNVEHYWKLPKKLSKGDSNDPTELKQVSWLEVTGSVSLIPTKTYQISLDVEMAPSSFGWRDIQAFLMAKVGKRGKYKWTKVKVVQDPNVGRFTIPDKTSPPLRIEVLPASVDNMLHFGLYEIWSGKWKGGLKIHQANVTEVTSTLA
ncbi:hypothetical protein ACFX2A_004584 [Malus domestica]